MKSTTEIYSAPFFDAIDTTGGESAEIVVPLVYDLLKPDAVIDVGCGRGTWLKAFRACGARIAGVDGRHVDRAELHIPDANFTAVNLSEPFTLEGAYDLAVCLEVGEHLPESMAPLLVRELTSVAPVVLFSAAVPRQGG